MSNSTKLMENQMKS